MAAPAGASAPRVLVADDDDATRHFLADAFGVLGAGCTTCRDGAEALALATATSFDLLLLDCRMPHAGAREVMHALRADPAAACRHAPIVAISAECRRPERERLLADGFCAVVRKPCTLATLQQTLRLAQADGHAPLLDDEAGVRSSGDPAIMAALRQLLHDELVILNRELERLAGEPLRFSERLHRLRSSCGFCGARALAQQAVRLQAELGAGGGTTAAMAHFRAALLSTIEALGGAG